MVVISKTSKLQHRKIYLLTCAPTEDSSQPARLFSLHCLQWRNFASLAIQNVSNEDSDQTVKMCWLIWIFNGYTCQKVCFLTLQLNFLTLPMLNKLRGVAHPLLIFSANEIIWSRLLIQIHILNDKQCSEEANGSGSALFAKLGYIWVQQDQG